MSPRQIIAMGGGGFSMEESPIIDDYILACARGNRVCFLPTASGEALGYIGRFYRAFGARGCRTTDLTLFGATTFPRRPAGDAEIAAFVLEQDVIYVGGGNTASALALWRVHGIDRALRAAYDAGVVLCGVSAGMICWFEASVTDSFGPLAALHDGLGFLPGSACPHYDGDPDRRPTYHALLADGFAAGYAADDGAAIHFVDERVHGVVTSRPAARAYRVELDGERGVVETVISSSS